MFDASLLSEDTSQLSGAPLRLDRAFEWLRARQRLIVLLTIGLQLLVLLTMIALHAAPYVFGEKIVLKVVPIDPRDMFRGDYVILSYDISRVPPAGITGIPSAGNWWSGRRGLDRNTWLAERTVYVTLEPDADGRHWHGVAAGVDRPSSGKFIRGKYLPPGWRAPVQFGIEAYYVQEGKGKDLERLRNSRELSAEVALAPWGQAKLIRLIAD